MSQAGIVNDSVISSPFPPTHFSSSYTLLTLKYTSVPAAGHSPLLSDDSNIRLSSYEKDPTAAPIFCSGKEGSYWKPSYTDRNPYMCINLSSNCVVTAVEIKGWFLGWYILQVYQITLLHYSPLQWEGSRIPMTTRFKCSCITVKPPSRRNLCARTKVCFH